MKSALILTALLAPLAPLAACPWHGDMFGGEPGGYLSEPVGGSATELQPATAQPALSREELMARQRELFLARYPQLAAGAAQKPAAETNAQGSATVPPTGNF
jgi:hypothetical protein